MNNVDWTLIRARLKEAILVLPHFFRNPVQGMRTLPAWDWPTILILQGAFAAACTILAQAVARSLLGVITGIVVGPIVNLLLTAIGAGFFYYVFFFFFRREIPYRQIYLTLVFASIPAVIVNILHPILPPAPLLGVVAAMGLLFVGFVDNFYLDRARVRNLLATLTLVYAACWAVQLIGTTKASKRQHLRATPESLDILEKELNND